MTLSRKSERSMELRLSTWIRIYERMNEDERRRESEIVHMTLDLPGKQAA